MLYLHSEHINTLGRDWDELIDVISATAAVIRNSDYAQPVKPYLRYGDRRNRIIAMPAYVGGSHPRAGIKWIASFPDNIRSNRDRASSVTILNEAGTGIPYCIINTAVVSAIRTAAVSGLFVREHRKRAKRKRLTIGVIGCGPIGRMHLAMLGSVLAGRIDRILLYDISKIDTDKITPELQPLVRVRDSWEECYRDSDIVITCTVAERPYINLPPRRGSLQLNVSLRDYDYRLREQMDVIIVDDWEEVNRENTDIENMSRHAGLKKEATVSLAEFVCGGWPEKIKEDEVVMVNPMGMAVFDMSIAAHYYEKARRKNIGIILPD